MRVFAMTIMGAYGMILLTGIHTTEDIVVGNDITVLQEIEVHENELVTLTFYRIIQNVMNVQQVLIKQHSYQIINTASSMSLPQKTLASDNQALILPIVGVYVTYLQTILIYLTTNVILMICREYLS